MPKFTKTTKRQISIWLWIRRPGTQFRTSTAAHSVLGASRHSAVCDFMACLARCWQRDTMTRNRAIAICHCDIFDVVIDNVTNSDIWKWFCDLKMQTKKTTCARQNTLGVEHEQVAANIFRTVAMSLEQCSYFKTLKVNFSLKSNFVIFM